MELRVLTAPAQQEALLNLPWDTPLADWPAWHLVALPRGISRHVVRFTRIGGTVYALKEVVEPIAMREYGLLRDLERLGLPTVEAVGVIAGRETADGTPLDAVLVTEHLRWSLPYRALFSENLRADTVERLVDALAALIVRLHLFGFSWNDCSLSNTLFRRDAGAFAAYLVDAETGELHPTLSDGQREHDLEIATVNIAGELLDLQAGERLDPAIDPVEVGMRVGGRYSGLWTELTSVEEFDVNDLWRISRRMERLNELGFDVDELDVSTDIGGRTVRLRPKVVDVGHHRRHLLRLTGIDAQENQARRMLNDLDRFRMLTDQQEEDEALVAYEWAMECYRPVLAAVPRSLRGKLESPELFHEVLEHKWYLSEQAGQDVPLVTAAERYVADVLAHKPDERAVIGANIGAQAARAGEDEPVSEDTQPFRVPWDELDEH